MKDEIVAKKYGRNLIVVIDGEKKTKVITTDKDKKDEISIKNKILLYNKKNNKVLKEEILYLVDSNKSKNDEVVAKKKGLKKAIRKEVKKEVKNKDSKQIVKSTYDLIKEIEDSDLTEKDAARLEKILNKSKANKKATTTTSHTTSSPRKGEW